MITFLIVLLGVYLIYLMLRPTRSSYGRRSNSSWYDGWSDFGDGDD